MLFQAEILSFGENNLGYGPYFVIPTDLVEAYLKTTTTKRVKCTLNNSLTIDRAISLKDTMYYILINQPILKTLGVSFGDTIEVQLIADASKYGVEITDEMTEVLYQDPEGRTLFHKLTPGKQRSLILLINKIKSTQLRIEKSFVILEHLKKQNGKLDFEQLNEDFKKARSTIKF